MLALRVGHEKLTAETGWQPRVSWEDGVLETIRWYAENQDRWIGRVDWLPTKDPGAALLRRARQSCTSSVQRYAKSRSLCVGACAQRKTTRRCTSSRLPASAALMTAM